MQRFEIIGSLNNLCPFLNIIVWVNIQGDTKWMGHNILAISLILHHPVHRLHIYIYIEKYAHILYILAQKINWNLQVRVIRRV